VDAATGLLLYDHLGRRETLAGSFGVDLASTPWGAGLKTKFRKGFVYSDARVDDARLVVFNVMDAHERGAEVSVQTRLASAHRQQVGGEASWRVRLDTPMGPREVVAKAIVNATGPWVKSVRESINGFRSAENVRHVKGSHIVVPRVHDGDHAYILQNADKRIVFVIPYEERYSLIGTTDIAVEAYESPHIDPEEIDYLLELANTYLAHSIRRDDIVWTTAACARSTTTARRIRRRSRATTCSSSIRPRTAARRCCRSTAARSRRTGSSPSRRSITSRASCPAQAAMDARAVLPGGDLPEGGLAAWIAELTRAPSRAAAATVRGLARRHGTRADKILGDAAAARDLGAELGNGLTEAEVAYLVRNEWARTGDDVLWREPNAGWMTEPSASASKW
jgi:glycerol-3-phosphate dehydrogenase